MPTREEMINNVCHRFGLENEWVIDFVRMCETWTESNAHNLLLNTIYDSAMNNPSIVMGEEE